MDRGTLNPNGSHVTQFDHWHSTPVKTSEIQDMTRRLTRSSPAPSSRTRHLIPQNNQTLSEMESATILKQRRELQLLIAELKDRDQELNTMAAAHRKQLLSWEQDRHRVLTLEQRNARLEDELQKRNEVIRAVTKHAHVVEAREKEGRRELNSTQQQLHEMGKKQQQSSQQYHHLEERIKSLNSTVMSLSAQVGALQVREEELSAMLRLKDKDVTEATNHIVDLSGRRKDLETSLKESGFRESRLLREAEENKRRYREARHASTRLKEELQEQVREGSAQREELIRLKQEGQLLRRELTLSGEGEDWKDELLGLARSKQERTDSELHCLRQLCENQQNDLQLLQLNLESARQALKQHDGSGRAVLETEASQGTERGLTVLRQTLSRNTDHQPRHQTLPLPGAKSPEPRDETPSGSTSDFTDATMDTCDLATNPSTPWGHSVGQASTLSHPTGGSVGHYRSGFDTRSSCRRLEDQEKERKEETRSSATTSGSRRKPAGQALRECFSSVSGTTSMASSRPVQLPDPVTPSCIAGSSPSARRCALGHVSFSDCVEDIRVTGDEGGNVSPPSLTGRRTSDGGRISNDSRRRTGMKNQEGKALASTTTSLALTTTSLAGRTEPQGRAEPSCGGAGGRKEADPTDSGAEAASKAEAEMDLIGFFNGGEDTEDSSFHLLDLGPLV
ncbi:coiled-coil domain-containing protein 62 isoform X2 [Hypomesus transpacificus]|uniref:coiled-coil domain-containing protein 62 isoform X2 n=1 Tax=Hypomesus transpacificus TaxID=137520 RepID=UPI001F07F9B8|nr:coiled-coil domain-containing protein 62 isoform X2 [Hypomesus transpacificus]